jgi:hypothetical protein
MLPNHFLSGSTLAGMLVYLRIFSLFGDKDLVFFKNIE